MARNNFYVFQSAAKTRLWPCCQTERLSWRRRTRSSSSNGTCVCPEITDTKLHQSFTKLLTNSRKLHRNKFFMYFFARRPPYFYITTSMYNQPAAAAATRRRRHTSSDPAQIRTRTRFGFGRRPPQTPPRWRRPPRRGGEWKKNTVTRYVPTYSYVLNSRWLGEEGSPSAGEGWRQHLSYSISPPQMQGASYRFGKELVDFEWVAKELICGRRRSGAIRSLQLCRRDKTAPKFIYRTLEIPQSAAALREWHEEGKFATNEVYSCLIKNG